MTLSEHNAAGGDAPPVPDITAARAFRWTGRPPVVMQVLPALDTGGVERGTVDIAAALAASGAISIVVSAGGRLVRELERSGGRHLVLPVASKNPWVMRRNAAALRGFIDTHRVDIVHARSRAPAWSAYWATRNGSARFLTTFHGTYGAGNALKRLYNGVMTRGDLMIAISRFIAGHVHQTYAVDPDRIRIVPRGVDLSVFDPAAVSQERVIQLIETWQIPPDRPVVMLPGRLTRWKGQAILIDALAKLGRADIVCLLVGSDQGRTGYRQELEHLARQRRLTNVVRIVDHCRDMAAAYMLADVVVSASTDPEAFGRVAVEAEAMGRPVVATDHGGARETVLPGRTGWLVPPNDAAALAETLDQVLAMSPAKRESLAALAQDHVRRHFSLGRMQAATLAVYDELMGGPRRRSDLPDDRATRP